jgi:hypothetical protein
MSVRGDVIPSGDSFRQAVRWISQRRAEATAKELPAPEPLWKLLEEAAQHFDLSPLETESLRALLAK